MEADFLLQALCVVRVEACGSEFVTQMLNLTRSSLRTSTSHANFGLYCFDKPGHKNQILGHPLIASTNGRIGLKSSTIQITPFAFPVNKQKNILEQLRKVGSIERVLSDLKKMCIKL